MSRDYVALIFKTGDERFSFNFDGFIEPQPGEVHNPNIHTQLSFNFYKFRDGKMLPDVLKSLRPNFTDCYRWDSYRILPTFIITMPDQEAIHIWPIEVTIPEDQRELTHSYVGSIVKEACYQPGFLSRFKHPNKHFDDKTHYCVCRRLLEQLVVEKILEPKGDLDFQLKHGTRGSIMN